MDYGIEKREHGYSHETRNKDEESFNHRNKSSVSASPLSGVTTTACKCVCVYTQSGLFLPLLSLFTSPSHLLFCCLCPHPTFRKTTEFVTWVKSLTWTMCIYKMHFGHSTTDSYFYTRASQCCMHGGIGGCIPCFSFPLLPPLIVSLWKCLLGIFTFVLQHSSVSYACSVSCLSVATSRTNGWLNSQEKTTESCAWQGSCDRSKTTTRRDSAVSKVCLCTLLTWSFRVLHHLPGSHEMLLEQ